MGFGTFQRLPVPSLKGRASSVVQFHGSWAGRGEPCDGRAWSAVCTGGVRSLGRDGRASREDVIWSTRRLRQVWFPARFVRHVNERLAGITRTTKHVLRV